MNKYEEMWLELKVEIGRMRAKIAHQRANADSVYRDWFWGKQDQRYREVLEMMESLEEQ